MLLANSEAFSFEVKYLEIFDWHEVNEMTRPQNVLAKYDSITPLSFKSPHSVYQWNTFLMQQPCLLSSKKQKCGFLFRPNIFQNYLPQNIV